MNAHAISGVGFTLKICSFYLDKSSKNIVGFDTYSLVLQKADCNELGGRRNGESYGGCFSRNWSNFCCDFTGCLAQITSSYLVAIAIGATCI
jgi:hypothetical protein